MKSKKDDASQPKEGQGASVLDGTDGGSDKVCLSVSERFGALFDGPSLYLLTFSILMPPTE